MPCDSIREVSIVLDKMDPATLKVGLADAQITANALSYQPDTLELYDQQTRRYLGAFNTTTRTYKASLTNDQEDEEAQEVAKRIKRAYSNGVVLTQAKKFGWSLKKSTTKQGLTQYEVTK